MDRYRPADESRTRIGLGVVPIERYTPANRDSRGHDHRIQGAGVLLVPNAEQDQRLDFTAIPFTLVPPCRPA